MLIAASPWIGHELPNSEDPQIKQTLILSHHSWKNRPERLWVWDLMPKNFVIIGKIELSTEDINASCNAFGGWESIPGQVFAQWRWDHDRTALLAEEEVKAMEKARSRQLSAETRAKHLNELTLDALEHFK